MPITCPKCAAVNPAIVTDRDAACPNCGVIYDRYVPRTRERKEFSLKSFLIRLFLIIGGLAFAIGVFVSIQRIVQARTIRSQLDTLSALAVKRNDAVALAGSTSRIALAGPVAALQGIRREAEGIEASGCAAGAKQALLGAISSDIGLFMEFMAEGDALNRQDTKWVNASLSGVALYEERANECRRDPSIE